MLQSFYTGNSGLNANKTWLSVISDNIANVNTTGFKQERVNFNDLVASSLTTYSTSGVPRNTEIGGGAFVANTIKDFSQGSFKTTNQPLSLALDGEGFFMVKNPTADLTYYTRAGDFRLDANGDVINPNGMKLQGWMLDDAGNIAGALGSINIPSAMEPKATDAIAFESPANLDAGVEAINKVFDSSDPSTYHYVNTVTVYDSLGKSHILKNYFVKIDINKWRVYSMLDDRIVTYQKGNDQFEAVDLEFNGKGELTNAYYYFKIDPADVHTNESVIELNDTGDFFIANRQPVLPGTLQITKDHRGNTVNWIDDGQGNIVDVLTGEIKGTIDYSEGKITIIGAAADGGSGSTLEVSFTDMSKYNTTAETSDGVYETGLDIVPGTLVIDVYDDNSDATNDITNGPWTDDGQGNIYDAANNKVGTIDYATGKITLTNTDGDANDTIQYYYVPRFADPADKATDVTNIQTSNIQFNRNDSRFLNNGAINTTITENFKNLTQLDSDFIFYAQQNGASKGDLMSISVTDDGVIKATYTNGQIRDVARLAVATFKDKEILVRKGDNLYLPNQQTFTPIIVPGGVISKIRSGMLEMSNVDISQEFINLITAQRAYQANAKTITTSDQILQTTMDIKR